MKNTIANLIVVAALSFSGAALAAVEVASKAQPPAAQAVTAASAVQATTAESTTPAPAQKIQPAWKRSTSSKHAKAKTIRSKSLDLRHCLELENNAAIANCAGE